MSSPSFKPCWSFCTPDCKLRQYDGCRRVIPRFDLPPPNEGVDHLIHLVFGRGDYDQERDEWHKAMNAWREAGKQGPPPPHWRKVVNDPWAGIHIYENPESEASATSGYRRDQLYDPLRLYVMLLDSPRIIKATHAAVEEDANAQSMRRLQRELISFFRNEFQQDFLSSGNSDDSPQRWKVAFKYLELSSELIASWLILDYEMNPLEWSTRVMQYGEPSKRWLEYLDKIDAISKPKNIKRIVSDAGVTPSDISKKSSLVIDEEVYIKGVTYDE